MMLGNKTNSLPKVYLARHGETAWSVTGQHTGRTDLALTEQGKQQSLRFYERLRKVDFELILTSPLQRAYQTSVLAGFEKVAVADDNLVEWDYGDFEGKTSEQIREIKSDWVLFRDGCPGGESVEAVRLRANTVIDRARTAKGNVLLFSSGHFLRLLATCWLGQDATMGRFLMLGTASLSILGYNHSLEEPAIHLWNEVEL